VSAPSSRSDLERRTFRRLVIAQVLANGPPSVVTAAFLVAFLETDPGYVVRNTVALAIYGALGFAFMVVFGFHQFPREVGWISEGRRPSDRERARLLLAPLAGAAGALAMWVGGAALFTLINLGQSSGDALVTGGTILLGGASTSALVYLSFERIMQPMRALALAESPPARPVGPGVGLRIAIAWLLTSAIPALTVLGVALAALLGARVDEEQLALAAGFFSAGVLIVGLAALRVATRAVATPILEMRRALTRIEHGDFGTRIEIADGGELGQLQAGFNRMAEGLGTYLDPTVAEHILRTGTALGGEEVEVTVMFLDVRDFTGFAGRASAPQVVSALNGLFERAVPIVHAHGGHVDKFIGDGLMAVFGAPRSDPEHAAHAIGAALEIARAVEEQPLRIGIGLNSGRVIAGNVGGGGRQEFSVIGDAVNVAARVESATRGTGDAILVAERTRELAGAFAFEPRAALPLGGGREVALFAPRVSA
jgi:adenylate cyclase